MFFLPADWWHTARCVTAEPSVTIAGNYVDDAVLERFQDAFADFAAMRALAACGAALIH